MLTPGGVGGGVGGVGGGGGGGGGGLGVGGGGLWVGGGGWGWGGGGGYHPPFFLPFPLSRIGGIEEEPCGRKGQTAGGYSLGGSLPS